jgi:GNAT superfamily N-acetyltransferase
MTEALTSPRAVPGVTVRSYRPLDHNACRRLWGELVQHRARLYGSGRHDMEAEGDPGAGFEEYLTQLNLSGMWVAEHEGGVGGFVGLMLEGRTGEVDPIVVAESLRGRGIGRALLARVVDESRHRGLRRLTIAPSVRDVPALRSLHAAGFATIASVTLSYDLRGAPPAEGAELDLYDLRFAV